MVFLKYKTDTREGLQGVRPHFSLGAHNTLVNRTKSTVFYKKVHISYMSILFSNDDAR